MGVASRCEPGLLKEVLGFAAMTREAHEEGPNAWVMALVDRVECVWITAAQGRNQCSFVVVFEGHVRRMHERTKCDRSLSTSESESHTSTSRILEHDRG